MTYIAIDNSSSVIRHYGKKGMKWRKNRDMEDPDVHEIDVASSQDIRDDNADLAAIKKYKEHQSRNAGSDYKRLESIYGKGKVTSKMLERFQKNVYGKLIEDKVKSRQDRYYKLRDRKNKVEKTMNLNPNDRSSRF